jgi:putative ABC transport system permease protein
VEEYTQKFNRGEAKVNSLFVKVTTPVDVDSVSKKIENLGYATDSLQTRVAGVNASVNALTLVLGMISLIILLSTMIAIFNTFFSDVFENITTIGILRSVGATRGFIFRLITSKALIVSLVGGIMGIILGTIVSLIANFWLLRELPFLAGHGVGVISLPWTLFVGTLLFALLLGIIASLYPAHYGSKLDPAQALRRG